MGRRVRVMTLAVLMILDGVMWVSPSGVTAAPPFTDVSSSDPAYTAINELAARGIIRGCDPQAGKFCPNDSTLRAQMAALIARAMGWDAENHGNQFTDRCDPVLGCVDDDLWRNVGTLQFRMVAKGYDATTYGPHNPVLQQQVILFISRAMVKRGTWQRQADNVGVYPNLPRNTTAERQDAQDITTYVYYAGSAPDAPADRVWSTYGQASSRAWFARALWQVLAQYPVSPSPSLAANQYKAQVLSEFADLSGKLQQVYEVCTQGNVYSCDIAYVRGEQALVDAKATNTELSKAAPPQCAGLSALIRADFEEAIGRMGDHYWNPTDAANRAVTVNTIFIAREYTVKHQPGNCR